MRLFLKIKSKGGGNAFRGQPPLLPSRFRRHWNNSVGAIAAWNKLTVTTRPPFGMAAGSGGNLPWRGECSRRRSPVVAMPDTTSSGLGESTLPTRRLVTSVDDASLRDRAAATPAPCRTRWRWFQTCRRRLRRVPVRRSSSRSTGSTTGPWSTTRARTHTHHTHEKLSRDRRVSSTDRLRQWNEDILDWPLHPICGQGSDWRSMGM